MITILGIVAVATIILDGWTNKWAIAKAVKDLFVNSWKKVSNS